MAGAGTGNVPWAQWMVPPPTFSGEQMNSSTARASAPTAAQMMSTRASAAPTSWKWILSTGTLWILDSAAPSFSKMAMAVVLVRRADRRSGGSVHGFRSGRGRVRVIVGVSVVMAFVVMLVRVIMVMMLVVVVAAFGSRGESFLPFTITSTFVAVMPLRFTFEISRVAPMFRCGDCVFK